MAFIQRINGTIYSDGWFGYQLETVLNMHKNEDVTLIITSPGGEVSEAIRLSDMIKAHGKVNIEFSGLAASAATWLGFAANKVSMHNDTLWLCHKALTVVDAWTTMNEDELDSYITKLQNEKKSLEVIDAIIAKKYLERCGKKKCLADVMDLMKEERYLSPEECLEWGFVDEIIEEPSCSGEILNMVDKFGLPTANISTVKDPQSDSFKIGDVINIVLEKIKDMFEPRRSNTSLTNVINDMNKKFNFINQLLGVEGIEQNPESNLLNLSEEQMNSISAKFNELSQSQTELNKAIEILDGISPAIKNINGIDNKINALKAIIDHVPAPQQPQAPATPAGASTTVNVEDGDPVNALVAGYMNKKV